MKRKLNTLLVIVSLLMIITSCNTNNSNLLSISPPFENINVEALEFSIDNTKDTLITLSNGTSLNIPKNAFTTKSGQTVSGKIKIQFKQFDNPSKVIASGIPMTFTDEEGKQQQMESAGMFDIRGFSDNQEIVIKEDKNIEVNLASKVDGDYDFFYFEEDETGTKGKWNTLVKNTLTDSSTTSIGRFLSFDTTISPETKILSNIKFNIHEKGIDGSSNWIYDETWNVLDISKPSFYPTVVSKFKSTRYWRYEERRMSFLSPDSSLIAAYHDKKIDIRNWQGKLVKQINKETGYFLNNNSFIAYNYDNYQNNNYQYDLYNSKWELIHTLKEAFNLHTLKNEKQLVYINLSKSNKTHFYIDIIDASTGGLIKSIPCKRHPRRSSLGGNKDDGITRVKINKNQDLIAINSGFGIQIYDNKGKLIKNIKYLYTYKYIEFLEYNDALLLESWDNSLTVWDWKNDQFITMPKEINKEKHIDDSDHPTQPVLLISNRDARFFLLWNWRKNTYTKHSTSHTIDQMAFSYDGAYIDEYNFRNKDEYARYWDQNGNEIIKVKNKPDEYTYIRFIKSSNRLTTNNLRTFCIHQPNGKLIKKFELSDSTYFEAIEYKDKFMLNDREGFLSFFDAEGLYIKSLQLDKESSIYWYNGYFEELISIRTPFNSYKSYTNQGELKYNLGGGSIEYVHSKSKEPVYLGFSHNDQEVFILKEGKKLKGNNEYQIVLQNKDKQFIGKITLDFNTKKAIEQYQEEFLKNYRIKRQKEGERKERESKLVRSFKVKKFGIYNWDRMYKQPNAVLCKAKLVLDQSSSLESYGSFLITGEKKNTVIKYSGLTIEKFVFDPTSFNQLLMILPDGRVAILSNEDFKKIKTDNLSEEDELVLNLKELGEVESMDYLNKILNN